MIVGGYGARKYLAELRPPKKKSDFSNFQIFLIY